MKILVTGDRNYDDLETIANTLEEFLYEFAIEPEDVMLIHGNALGADTIAAVCGECLRMDVKPYPAHWRHTEDCPEGCSEYVGRAAGPIRNKRMLTEHPDLDLAFAFHKHIETSKGTKNMMKQLEKMGVGCRLIDL